MYLRHYAGALVMKIAKCGRLSTPACGRKKFCTPSVDRAIQVNVGNIMEKGSNFCTKCLSNLKTSKGYAALYHPRSSP